MKLEDAIKHLRERRDKMENRDDYCGQVIGMREVCLAGADTHHDHTQAGSARRKLYPFENIYRVGSEESGWAWYTARVSVQALLRATTETEMHPGHWYDWAGSMDGQLIRDTIPMFKVEHSIASMMQVVDVDGERSAKPFDMRRWDMADERIYQLAFAINGKPKVPAVAFEDKATKTVQVWEYKGMEFTSWAPGWVFLILGRLL